MSAPLNQESPSFRSGNFKTTHRLSSTGEVLPSPHTPNPCAQSQREHLARLRKAPKPAALAAMLRARIPDAAWTPDPTGAPAHYWKLDCFQIIDSPDALERAAVRITHPWRQPSTTVPRDPHYDALRLYGTATNARDTIERHLDTLGDDLDPNVRKRAEKLLSSLRAAVAAEERAALLDALPDDLKAVMAEREALRNELARKRLTPKQKREIREQRETLSQKAKALATAAGIPWSVIS